MHAFFKCKILSQRKRHLWSDQTLNDRVIGQVDEHGHVVGNTAFLEGAAEEVSHVVFDTHGGEHDSELLTGLRVVAQRCLLYDLGRQIVVGKSVAGEDRQLLAADQRHKAVDGRDTGTDIVTGILPRNRI